ncbi:conserved protein of unknown function [Pseudorhizobium banfieldiae]|uniref:Protoheme IX farnesyltransferase n=1 Tax=Pseudorhizobium banfieldiae TaxID=1125847 RepID=L0NBS7_9HYPH|nr:hypothetical protein [Pseudorhizobium banfieldiae]CAD6601620.1 hypothetical protein RNT25_00914 [arsenite-oxidising bacterium NT-25]CAD6606147.1 hypothetical protein RTCK_01785 [Rhizobium sp. TCK]CAD6613596.1 hypothetical protein RKHAN_02595 [Rhizobium sp. Khangiran2]CCF18241.1 conserved protein of unknown function [Pseudorhizobium banfieldiae]
MIDTIKVTDKQKKSRRNRNIALGLVLAGLVGLFYVITIVKIGGIGG